MNKAQSLAEKSLRIQRDLKLALTGREKLPWGWDSGGKSLAILHREEQKWNDGGLRVHGRFKIGQVSRARAQSGKEGPRS